MPKDYGDMYTFENTVREIQRIAAELGHTPLRQELEKEGMSKYAIQNHGYSILIAAAGLDPNPRTTSRKKISNEIFEQPLPETLKNKVIKSPKGSARVLIAGDMHLPWIHQPTLDAFFEFNKEMQPDYVVQIGDLYDMYAHTRFPKSMNIYTPIDEEKKARDLAEQFWQRIQNDNPNVKCIQIKGNHDIRPVKRTQEVMPSMEHFVEHYMTKLFTFDNVTTIEDHREILRLNEIAFHHGFLGQLGAHRDQFLENMVVGHTHLGGVVYRALQSKTIWELNVGLMGDPQSKVMTYTNTKENKWTLGFGYIDEFGPRFIHL